LQGAAAILGDLDIEHPYNALRFSHAFEKHFFQYLFALLQRLTLHKLRQRAADVAAQQRHSLSSPSGNNATVHAPENRRRRMWRSVSDLLRHAFIPEADEHDDPLKSVRERLLSYSVTCEFAQSQLSESAQDYYELARDGLHVDEAWTETRRTLDDIDSKRTADQSAKKPQYVDGTATQSGMG
jgi:hypothetical protein